MKVFAGCVGKHSDLLQTTCRQVLNELADYGQTIEERHFPTASVGSRERDQASRRKNAIATAGSLIVVGDIRLDNRREIEAALDIQHEALSDTDLVARAWERWLARTPEKLLGDFAFAVWNQSDFRLTLVRDPTGQRPLFYSLADSYVAFASMPGALSKALAGKERLNLYRLAAALTGHEDPSEATNFAGVFRVLPGSVTTISNGIVESRYYWHPPRDFLQLTDEEFSERYRSLLFDAVSRRVGASTKLGSQLSAGWDSNGVTAAAAAMGGHPIAFTAAPREGFSGQVLKHRHPDESNLASITARHHSIEHHVIRPVGGPLAKLRDHNRLYQDPQRNVVNMEWWSAILRAAADRDVDVLLTGQIGNLSINCGGLWVLGEWLQQGDFRRWAQEARAAKRSSTASWRGIWFNSGAQWLPDWLVSMLERRAGHTPEADAQTFIRPEWISRTKDYARATPYRREESRPYAVRLGWIRSQDWGAFRVGGLGESGIEEHDPLSDRQLVDFSFQVPPDQFLRRGEWRPMARRALSSLVPAEVLDSPSRGYQGADWYERVSRSDLYDLLEEIRTSSGVCDLLDLDKIRATIDRWPASGTAALGETALFRSRLLAALTMGTFIQDAEQRRF